MDLITQEALGQLLAAAGITLTSAQQAVLPTITSAASRSIQRYASRQLGRAVRDELVTPVLGMPILLSEWPVNAILRVCQNPTTVLSITNASTANQRAQVQLATSGTTDQGLVVTGLNLQRVASGVASTSTITFTASQTLQALADQVNALGNGWTAVVASDYGLWPVSDLRSVQGYSPARSPQQANLMIHVEDVAFTLSDEKAGVLWLNQSSSDSPWRSSSWGPPLETAWGDQELRGQPAGVRVVYDAGFDPIPDDIQQAAFLTVSDWIRQLDIDPRLTSETAGAYAYELDSRLVKYHLPNSVLGMLSTYRSLRL